MSGSSYDRRKKRRADLRKEGPLMPVSPLTLAENGKDEVSDTPKPIAPPEPANEAEGARFKLSPVPKLDDPNTKWVCEEHPDKEWPHLQDGKECPGPGMLVSDLDAQTLKRIEKVLRSVEEALDGLDKPKKRRSLWNFLRKLVGRLWLKRHENGTR